VTRHMVTFSVVAAVLGAGTAFAGFSIAYRFDLPLGPTDVALAIVVLVLVAAVREGVHVARVRRARA
jgi:ABC-type Mn2+/Zn2+ transport system permease subunit